MKVGIFIPEGIPQSFKVYTENVLGEIRGGLIEAVRFTGRDAVPAGVDLIWDVRSGGGNPPPERLLCEGLPPLVVTIHGFAPMSLSPLEYYRTWRERFASIGYARRQMNAWGRARPYIRRVIAVSSFTRDEVVRFTGIAPALIDVCLHGVAAGSFGAPGGAPEGRPYLLHVSNDEPRKNIDRIVQAFRNLRREVDVDLILKLPVASRGRYDSIDGVRTITDFLATDELAALYAGARGFVFPSLYEGFGLPILEAMASGCPVITSNVSACPEAAGDAALLVDPREPSEILAAMRTLCKGRAVDPARRATGLDWSEKFTWKRCAEAHLAAFGRACPSAH